jgi:hypothetical protein
MKQHAGGLPATGREPASLLPIVVGDYLHSDRDLYRVEQLVNGRALLEDCRTCDLIDVADSALVDLRRVVMSEGGHL